MVKREMLEPLSKEEIINVFLEFANNIEKQISDLKEGIRVLQEENRQLKQKINSSNSSQPPSHDYGKVPRQKSLRTKGNKKPGGQPGHKGSTLNQTANPDKIIFHKPSEICPNCGNRHTEDAFELYSKRQVVDIPPITKVITEHQVFQVTCRCGCVSEGKFPIGANAPVQYGDHLTAFVSYLSARQYIAFNRIPEMLKCICNISLSEGTVFNMLERVANGLQPLYKGIKTEVQNSETLGSDETGVKVKSKSYWAWTWQTLSETLISIVPKRGFTTIEGVFPNGFPEAVLVSDSLATQLKTPALKHQLCLAHLLRELNAFIEITDIQWPVELKKLFKRAIKLKTELSPTQYNDYVPERSRIIAELQDFIDKPPQTEIKKLIAFHKRLKKWKDSVFTFLYYPNVPYDNNASERAIRNIKVKQKVSGGFRSEHGANIFSVIRSVIDTWTKRNVDVFGSLKFALHVSQQTKAFVAN